jgi:toxin ParE1/3/4
LAATQKAVELMRLVWTKPARADVNAIWDYLAERNPYAAEMVDSRILREVEGLIEFPKRGRPGRVAGTRELVIPSLPYLVICGVEPAEVVVYRVVHGAQDIRSWAGTR